MISSFRRLYPRNPRLGMELALCSIKDTPGVDPFLHPSERSDLKGLRSTIRRNEWLSSRIALKCVLCQMAVVGSPSDARIVKNRVGRPSIRVPEGRVWNEIPCSISHKNGMAAVCVARDRVSPVGIDIEWVTKKPEQLSHTFIHEDDCADLIPDSRERCTLIWCCKEAASKALGKGLLLDFKRLSVRIGEAGETSILFDNRTRMEGEYIRLNGAFLAFCQSNDSYQASV